MEKPATPNNESQRLAHLESLEVMDTDAEPEFDDFVRIAAHIFDVPIALVSLVDANRQWFKARVGLSATETPREVSFCGHAVASGEALVIPDARADARFADNPLVTDDPHVCFYAGAPLSTEAGVLGTLCVIDHEPRQPTPAQLDALRALARQVVNQLQLRQVSRQRAARLEMARRRDQTLARDIDYLGRLHEITSSGASFDVKVGQILTLGREAFDLDLGIVSHIVDDDYTVLHASAPADPPDRGTRFQLARTYCRDTLRANGPTSYFHTGAEAPTHPAYADFGLEAYLGSPLFVEGERFGTLNFSSPRARLEPFSARDLSLIQLFAQWVGNEISSERARQALRRQKGFFESIFRDSPEPMVLCDEDLGITHVNPSFTRLFGYELDELRGKPLSLLQAPADNPGKDEEEQVSTRPLGIEEVLYRKRDGSTFIGATLGAVMHDETGAALGHATHIRDITRRKQIERMKNEFVSTVSHELRTPLTSIRGSLGLLIGGVGGEVSERASSLLQIACDNTDRLVRLINDMLDVDKIESGRLTLRYADLDLVELVQRAMESNSSFAAKHQVSFELTTSPQSARVMGDDDRLTQVIDNLLSNAAKYAEGSGVVQISIEGDGEHWRVAVSDRGPGIPAEFRGRVFTRFSQADSSSSRRKSGTGLGLSIVRSIVEMHGGKVGYESREGGGTVFFFTLRQLTRRVPAGGREQPRVLIVEDDADVARLLQLMLAQRGFDSDVAHSAAHAWVLASEDGNDYQLVTLDVRLPDADGVDLLRRLRAQPKTADVPVVVVSAVADKSSRAVAGEALGIVDWLQKPIEEQRLQRILAKLRRGHVRPHILHVEDDPSLVEVTRAQLSELADVTVASSLTEAEELLKHHSFDLAIVDLMLPDGHAQSFIERIQAGPRPIPVVVYSALEEDAALRKLVAAFLVKSKHSERDLLETVGKLTERLAGS